MEFVRGVSVREVLVLLVKLNTHSIFIVSSGVYVLIMNECEVSQLSKPRVSDFGTQRWVCVRERERSESE